MGSSYRLRYDDSDLEVSSVYLRSAGTRSEQAFFLDTDFGLARTWFGWVRIGSRKPSTGDKAMKLYELRAP